MEIAYAAQQEAQRLEAELAEKNRLAEIARVEAERLAYEQEQLRIAEMKRLEEEQAAEEERYRLAE